MRQDHGVESWEKAVRWGHGTRPWDGDIEQGQEMGTWDKTMGWGHGTRP